MLKKLHPDAGIETQLSSPSEQNQLIIALRRAGDQTAEMLVSHPELESAWLSSMAHMEATAAYGIKKAICKETPKEFIPAILAHYADEMRHAQELLEMKKVPVSSQAGMELETALCQSAKKMTFGFFNHPVIQEISAHNKYAGYVHAALTIEQIPFQMYAHFHLKSRPGSHKNALTRILKEEYQHLAQGKKMYQLLERLQKFPLDQIQTIEMELCLKLMNEMTAHIGRYFKDVA